MKSSFSFFDRNAIKSRMSTTEYDVFVIGGGITGAGIALDAASRGLKTALVDMQDFAAGTSSRSTKLIHGGLRYLKNFEFDLVQETGSERAVIFKNAPHLVLPEKMLLPIIQKGTYGKFLTSMGLWVYDYLAGVKAEDRRKILSKKDTLRKEPLLDEKKVLGGGYYAEYRTDDARLTIEIIKTAHQYGADCLNYAKVNGFGKDANRITGLEIFDVLAGNKFSCKAKMFVNAAGPWVDRLRSLDEPVKGKKLHLTKGIHLVVPYEKFPVKQSVYFDAPDGRMIFAIPRGRVTYIGTTDTTYQADLENPRSTYEDVVYLLKSITYVFPGVQLQTYDIISSWAGLRPLIHQEGKSPSDLSRKDEIILSESGLISIAGGKLTGYRKMAKRTVDLVCKKLHLHKSCQTKNIAINGGEFLQIDDVYYYIEDIALKLKSNFQLDRFYAEYLVRNYGKQCDVLLQKMEELIATDRNNEFSPFQQLVRAELWFGIHHEMVVKMQDFFIRRTGRMFYENDALPELMPVVLQDMRQMLGWSEERSLLEEEEMRALYEESHSFV